jgi:hypothetical protein
MTTAVVTLVALLCLAECHAHYNLPPARRRRPYAPS